jgi:hypothetical protein
LGEERPLVVSVHFFTAEQLLRLRSFPAGPESGVGPAKKRGDLGMTFLRLSPLPFFFCSFFCLGLDSDYR